MARHRKAMGGTKDRRIFNVTARKTKTIHLGYLPIEIRALPEGSLVPVKVPVLTIHNTLPEFYWLTNYLETVLSAELWKATNTATIAFVS